MSERGSETQTIGASPALELARTLAGDVGPRRPASAAERIAAELVREALADRGLDARVEDFPAYSSFAYPYGLIAALASAPLTLPRSRTAERTALAAAAAGLLALEGGLVHTPLSGALARRQSQNVIGELAPAGHANRTLCITAHLDSSRSGLLFHPRFARFVSAWTAAQGLAVTIGALEPLLARSAAGRALLATARGLSLGGLAALAERELRGVDVPGANDNASGVGAVVQLAGELASRPPESTRVVVLLTGGEEAGLLGMQAFLRRRDTRDWLFLNFDGVGAPVPLRYLPVEGILRRWPADRRLLALADRLSGEPEVELLRADRPIGLTYDATAVLARGGRALTLVAAAEDGTIPHYHQPSDGVANLSADHLANALEVGRRLIAAIDAGAAD